MAEIEGEAEGVGPPLAPVEALEDDWAAALLDWAATLLDWAAALLVNRYLFPEQLEQARQFQVEEWSDEPLPAEDRRRPGPGMTVVAVVGQALLSISNLVVKLQFKKMMNKSQQEGARRCL